MTRVRTSRGRSVRLVLAAAAFAFPIEVWSQEPAVGTIDQPLVAPGPDTEAVAAVLRRIVDGREAARKKAADFRLRGRASLVSARPVGPTGEARPEFPAPEWRAFTLVQKGGKRRFEVELPKDERHPGGVTNAYRLFDGETFFALNAGPLEIAPVRDLERDWSGYTYDVSGPLEVHDGREIVPVEVACRTHLARLTGKADDGSPERPAARLACYGERGLLVVDLNGDSKASVARSTFWVDPAKGYAVVRSFSQLGTDGGGLFNVSRCEAEYAEAAPGTFLLRRAEMVVSDLGTVARRDGQAAWGRRVVDVTSTEVGDFGYDEAQFRRESIPVPPGTPVTDLRGGPN